MLRFFIKIPLLESLKLEFLDFEMLIYHMLYIV